MSLREKVGQLYVIRPDALNKKLTSEEVNNHNNNGVTEITSDIKKFYEKYPAGNFVLFGKNITDPNQLQIFSDELHNLSQIPSLLFIDEEGGSVSRLANHEAFVLPRFRNMKELGDRGDELQALRVGQTIGSYLNFYGLDVDFAPVCDVNSNPENPIIGPRAFSSNPSHAAFLSMKVLQGLRDENIEGCLKHFPGHGDTRTDSHKGYTECLKTLEELRNCELVPFIAGIENDAQFIMTAHVAYPNVTKDNTPATLSTYFITDLLRNEMGYKGIIITDAMNMDAIAKYYSEDTAAILAIQAGVDMILMPNDFQKSFDSVVKAVKSKKIKEKRIDESVYRILQYKQKHFNFLNLNRE
ncbi:MAG: hypothetical protein KIG96_11175 [Treponema sp.]|nr:hypothetical protein [Treponema sp.]